MSYDNFAHTFSQSRKNHPWPELDFIISDIRDHGYMSVLDVGCGNARFIQEWESGIKNEKGGVCSIAYLGVDSSKGMIEEARKLHPEYDFEVHNMLSLSTISPADYFTSRLFDTILFLASYHHLASREERIQVLSDVKKLLTPGGRIYMTNWNLREQSKYEKSHRGNGDYDIKIGEYSRFYHGFTLPELEELFVLTEYDMIENRVFEGRRNIVSILEEK